MTLSILFWVLYIVFLIFSLWTGYVPDQPYPFTRWGGSVVIFILVGILGWAVFGAPVHGGVH
jgi:hypothetical protein